MGNRCSRKTKLTEETAESAVPRKIYVGKVPEIEEEPPFQGRRWSGRRTNRDTLSHGTIRRRADEDTPTKTVVRRNSSVASASKRRQLQASTQRRATRRGGSKRTNGIEETESYFKQQTFCSNYIKTSRYTIFTFLPKNLYEQCRRWVNFYFITITILMLFIPSPENPWSSMLGIIVILTVTAIKQGYEDYLRHKADGAVNNRDVDVVRNGILKTVKSKDLKVGDIVRLEDEDPLPADILVLSSSDEFHRCQITTANLDGESNLKMRYCPPGLPVLQQPSDFSSLNAVMECEHPNANLYSFNGNLLLLKRQFQQPESMRSRKSEKFEMAASTSDSMSRKLGLAIRDSFRAKLNTKILEDEEEDEVPSASEFLEIPITMENMLLRGTKLKNTDSVYGLVIYTGVDTRLALNSKQITAKYSTADKSINSFLILIMILMLLAVTLYTVIHFFWLWSPIIESAWYLGPPDEVTFMYVVEISFAFLIVFYYVVPLSLYVTIELQTFFGAMFFVWDNDMKCPETGAPPLCNTSDLNEELGQIEYLFSDKTGTLTENIMEFRDCSVNGVRYSYHKQTQAIVSQQEPKTVLDISEPKNSEILQFFRTLALCHTVQVTTDEQRKKRQSSRRKSFKNGEIEVKGSKNSTPQGIPDFQASSPDELALLQSCAALGVRFVSDKNEILTLDVFGRTETYKRHFVLEFDADRKCMSVIVENSQNEIWMLTKGAESSIFPKGISGPIAKTNQHVDEFAQMGLRTLAVAQKQMTQKELEDFTKEVNKARRQVQNREEKMRELYKSVESQYQILGATGVEDQLQDGVQDTLTALGHAGIRVWVLTGDKVETAVNVAVACGLLTATSKQMRLTNFKTAEDLTTYLEGLKRDNAVNEDTTFIIDGESLAIAFETCSELFCSVLMNAGRVVCCRLAPLQKAQVVSMVKSTKSSPITAAVGDGANDVAMIQEAHIGLGIFGKEGRQAARSADFALARFSFLKKAILVHGHWYYVRLATLIHYFFYKNLVLIMPPSLSAIQSAFSSQTLFNAFFMTYFNIFFTSAPIFAYALQEQPVPYKTLLNHPELYKNLTKNSYLTWKEFGVWMIRAFWHSALIFSFVYFAIDGLPIEDWTSYGVFMVTCVVAIVNIALLVHMKYITIMMLVAYACSFVSFFGLTAIITEVDLTPGSPPNVLYHVFFAVQEQGAFWFTIFILAVTCILPDILLQYIRTPLRRWRNNKVQPIFKLLPTA